MTAQQRLLVMIVFAVAVVGGILAFTVIGRGGSPAPSSVAGASAGPTAPPVAVTATPVAPTITPTAAATPAPTATPTPTAAPSATPKPTTAPGPVARIVLTQLKLDAADDPAGQDRIVTFTTGGSGTITVALSPLSQGNAWMCLFADGKNLTCQSNAAGKMTAKTTKKAATFELTLRGTGIEKPVVEVAITFPATTPAVTIANARFDGTMFPETNGIQAIVQPRSDGDLHLTADWGGHPFLYEVDLMEQGGAGSQTLANQGPATRVDVRLPVTAPNPWKVLLQNIETGFGVTPMTATIAWP